MTRGTRGVTSECWHLEVVHLGEGDDEGELIILHVELEQRPAPDNLEAGQHNLSHVHMGNQNIAGHLPGEKEGFILMKIFLPKVT